MDDSLDEAVPWASAAAAASPDEDGLETGAQAADSILDPIPSRKVEAISARIAPPVAAGLLRYGPHAALAAWLLGVAWLVGSSLVGPARTVPQRASVQSAETGHTAQKTDVETVRAAQGPSAKDATDPQNTRPRLDAAKTEISGGIRETPGKAERLRSKSAERLSKAGERLDRIGLKIAALLAAAPAADRSAPSRRSAENRRKTRATTPSIRCRIRPLPAFRAHLEPLRARRAQPTRPKTNTDEEQTSREREPKASGRRTGHANGHDRRGAQTRFLRS